MPDKITATNSMNEQDVREAIIRPLLVKLGYEYNTPANIRTNFPLRYSQVFLGRKKPATDPGLEGRPDYMCEVVSCGRWILEVKRPDKNLTLDDSQQAHTYATHPDVAASFYLLSNGKEFRLFKVGNPTDPILVCSQNDLMENFVKLQSLIGPEAIRQQSKRDAISPGKPIGFGVLRPKVDIVAGTIFCKEASCSNSILRSHWKQVIGQTGSVSGDEIFRDSGGVLSAKLNAPGAFAIQEELTKVTGVDLMTFRCSDEYLSTDELKPNIFQGISTISMPKGKVVHLGLLMPSPFPLPFDWDSTCFVEAIGVLKDGKYTGTYSASYSFKVRNASNDSQSRQLASVIHNLELGTGGDFTLAIGLPAA